MCSNACYGEGGIDRAEGLIRPAAAVIAYTTFAGAPAFTSEDPPAYFIVGTEDWIVPWREVKGRAAAMSAKGIDVECHVLENAQHGFGVGGGTPAEGWMEEAMDFWEKHMERRGARQ